MRAVPGAGRYEGRESLGVRRPRSLLSPGYDKYTCASHFSPPVDIPILPPDLPHDALNRSIGNLAVISVYLHAEKSAPAPFAGRRPFILATPGSERPDSADRPRTGHPTNAPTRRPTTTPGRSSPPARPANPRASRSRTATRPPSWTPRHASSSPRHRWAPATG